MTISYLGNGVGFVLELTRLMNDKTFLQVNGIDKPYANTFEGAEKFFSHNLSRYITRATHIEITDGETRRYYKDIDNVTPDSKLVLDREVKLKSIDASKIKFS